jgi:hypothetical protein
MHWQTISYLIFLWREAMLYLSLNISKSMCKSIFANFFHLVIAAVFVVVFAVSAAMGQMTYGTNYSDTWTVDYNQPWTDADGYDHPSDGGNPYVMVCGYGAVDGNAASYSHYYSPLEVTLTSPNGRTSNTSSTGNGYVRADVGLELIEPGNYYTAHTESAYCPGCNCFHNVGGGGSSKVIGVSFSAYRKVLDVDPSRAVYQLVTPCNVNCVFYPSGAAKRFSPTGSLPNYIKIGEPWFNIAGYIVCEGWVDYYEESNSPLFCYEWSV